MVPQEIVELPSLPRNPNGKIDRKHLVDQFSNLFEESGG